MKKSKLSALLSLTLVFVSGAVLGAFAYRLYFASPVLGTRISPTSNQKKSPEEFRKNYIATITKDVKLDPEQIKQLNVILDETRDEFNQLNEKSKPERDEMNARKDAFDAKWRPAFEAIHNKQVERINAILREDQRSLYASFQAERARQRKLQRDQHKKQ